MNKMSNTIHIKYTAIKMKPIDVKPIIYIDFGGKIMIKIDIF